MSDNLPGGKTFGMDEYKDHKSLSDEEYVRVLKFQNGCYFCRVFMTGKPLNPRSPNIDHWKVEPGLCRGILCRMCNLKLGEVERMERQATEEEILYLLNPPCYQLGIYRKYLGGEA